MTSSRFSGRVGWAVNMAVIYLLPAALINVGNVGAYLFQVVLGRSLDVEAFGNFNAIFGVVLVLTAPASFIPLVVAQAALALARNRAEEKRLFQIALYVASVGGALLMGIAALAALVLHGRIAIGASVGLAALTTILLQCVQPIPVGFLQAHRRYVAAAMIQGGNPLARFLCALLLVRILGSAQAGAMWSVALPSAVCVVIGFLMLPDIVRGPTSPLPAKAVGILRRTTWRQAALAGLLTAFANLDVVVAKIILPSADAGLYAGAAVVSRTAVLLPSALAAIIFTESARNHEAAVGSKGSRWTGVVLTALVAAGIGLVFAVAGQTVVTVLLGAKFAASGKIVQLTGPAMATLSVSQAMIMSLAGSGDFRTIWPLSIVVVGLFALPPLLSLGATGLATFMLAANAALVIVCLFWFRGLDRGKTPGDAYPPPESAKV